MHTVLGVACLGSGGSRGGIPGCHGSPLYRNLDPPLLGAYPGVHSTRYRQNSYLGSTVQSFTLHFFKQKVHIYKSAVHTGYE